MEILEEPQTTVKPKNSGTGNFSNNPIIDKLSRTHIAAPISIFIVVIAGLVYYAFAYTNLNPVLIPFLFIAGVLSFTLIEYLVHRYVFHMPTDSERKKIIQHKIHGLHHEYPKDKTRLAMPPILSITLASTFFLLFYVMMNVMVFGFLPGFMAGYTMYISIHYIIHAYPPPNNFFKQLWINHAVHHYKDGNAAFGVSSPLWDYVFGTMPNRKNIK
jgi:sterol desaturase/sphingolipid hydroxylase (fatty acid hydroxylase superfamily)